MVQRLSPKLEIMSYMSTFLDIAHTNKPRIEAIYLAAKNTKNSDKFKKILEIILAFGNYMNSCKKGSAYGFKLQSLDNLSTTKSSDKRSTIVNYIVEVVNTNYPSLKGFETELKYIEKAAQFSLENIITDVQELERGMAITRRELVARQNNPSSAGSARLQHTSLLADFVSNARDQLAKLSADANNAKAAFTECLEYYGESQAKSVDTNAFFAVLVRFVNGWRAAEAENEKRKRLEKSRQQQQAAAAAAAVAMQLQNNNDLNDSISNTNNNKKKQAAMLIDEIKSRNNSNNAGGGKSARHRNMINPDEVKDGTPEQIIMDIKSEPYRTNDAMRRSVRRNVDRLMSKPFDEDL